MMARSFVYSVVLCSLALGPALAQPLAPQMPPSGSAETAIGAQLPAPVPLSPQQTTPQPAQATPPVAGPFVDASGAEAPLVNDNVQEEMARAIPEATEGVESATPPAQAEAAEPAEAEAPSLPFDIQPFLSAMVELRGAALTCAPFVGDDPVGRTANIPTFFAALQQQLPELTNETTQSSLRRFIGSQAASLCANMLDNAFTRYARVAADYQAQKPQEWPPAPPAQPGLWCTQPFCLDR